MLKKLTLLYVFVPASIFLSCTASKDPMRPLARKLQKGTMIEDTSYVYNLPYDTGTANIVVQGYFSRYSHKNRVALDFKMKRGTRILAARSGKVVQVKNDGRKGGINKKYRAEGNHVVIQHEDGTRAGYWHLQYNGSLVKVGDTVQQGQVIGLSGKTGYALFPHLHFSVWKLDAERRRIQVPTHFRTSKGIIYLRPFRRYFNSK
jgi:murein DD-endopeptidase MepM/ murein hydrolase activator NlpD